MVIFVVGDQQHTIELNNGYFHYSHKASIGEIGLDIIVIRKLRQVSDQHDRETLCTNFREIWRCRNLHEIMFFEMTRKV